MTTPQNSGERVEAMTQATPNAELAKALRDLEYVRDIFNRDGIRPLRGLAFNDDDLSKFDAAILVVRNSAPLPPSPAAGPAWPGPKGEFVGTVEMGGKPCDIGVLGDDVFYHWGPRVVGDSASESIKAIRRRVAEGAAAPFYAAALKLLDAHRKAGDDEKTKAWIADAHRLAAENAKQWIPVSERPPADGQRVIAISVPSGGVVFAPTCCTFQRGLWCNDNWHRDVELDGMSHWMPMPASPTPENEASK